MKIKLKEMPLICPCRHLALPLKAGAWRQVSVWEPASGRRGTQRQEHACSGLRCCSHSLCGRFAPRNTLLLRVHWSLSIMHRQSCNLLSFSSNQDKKYEVADHLESLPNVCKLDEASKSSRLEDHSFSHLSIYKSGCCLQRMVPSTQWG